MAEGEKETKILPQFVIGIFGKVGSLVEQLTNPRTYWDTGRDLPPVKEVVRAVGEQQNLTPREKWALGRNLSQISNKQRRLKFVEMGMRIGGER